ncbi:hypothetical protein BJ875DRAFT_469267 [Amylocarpus encephaloides]|uniref:Uncharacterized protein n=1 Tax=Amylocarpus encephaloides TaxID=45428 RepID=A0A9P8C2K6_9HELO|nr:hypothetical protein BJ875DRAFT_469267 [Amylocarpus encephaloides]
MEDMKYITKAVGRSTPGRLDKKLKRRNTNLTIPSEVYDLVAPYIKDVLRHKIPLSIEEKAPTFLTIENYVDMKELLWQHDHYNFVHEGCRVDLSPC